jgi:hypothetical protein
VPADPLGGFTSPFAAPTIAPAVPLGSFNWSGKMLVSRRRPESAEETAMSLKEKSHFTLRAAALADWIDSQPDCWWLVDGDPRLMGDVNFPCPSDELAPAIRRIGKDLLLYDKTPGSRAHGESIDTARLDQFADVSKRRRRRTFLLSWADSDIEWLLIEDEAWVEK